MTYPKFDAALSDLKKNYDRLSDKATGLAAQCDHLEKEKEETQTKLDTAIRELKFYAYDDYRDDGGQNARKALKEIDNE